MRKFTRVDIFSLSFQPLISLNMIKGQTEAQAGLI